MGDRFANTSTSEELNTLNENFLRLNLDGKIPSDNPIANRSI
ncbi:MAG: PQQ-dependent sugar dehydrogenase [Psychroserpens sp.]|nr:PQQ-dependent sugar dehydrogenase [Psychroserpens sp.]